MAVTNVESNSGSGGAKWAVENDGTQNFPYASLAVVTTPVGSGAAAVPIQDGGNSITVDGTATVTAAAAFPVTDNSGSLTVDAPVATPVFVRLSDGSAAIATLPVSLASVPSHAVTNAGTFAAQVDGAALTALQLIDDSIFVDDAAFTIGTSKVNVSGGAVVAHGAAPDAADAGDAGAPIMNRHRVPFVIGGHPNVKVATYLWTGATTDDNVLPAIAAGTKYVITGFSITIDQATTVGVAVRLGFGATVVPALPAANGDAVDGILFYHPGMVPGGGVVRGDGSGILGVGGDGEEVRITAGATTGGTGVVTLNYYAIES